MGEVPHVSRERRHEEEGRAVEIAGDADQRGERRASCRVKGRQCAGAGEPHQPLGVGDRLGMGLIRVSGGVRHDGLDAWGGLE